MKTESLALITQWQRVSAQPFPGDFAYGFLNSGGLLARRVLNRRHAIGDVLPDLPIATIHDKLPRVFRFHHSSGVLDRFPLRWVGESRFPAFALYRPLTSFRDNIDGLSHSFLSHCRPPDTEGSLPFVPLATETAYSRTNSFESAGRTLCTGRKLDGRATVVVLELGCQFPQQSGAVSPVGAAVLTGQQRRIEIGQAV